MSVGIRPHRTRAPPKAPKRRTDVDAAAGKLNIPIRLKRTAFQGESATEDPCALPPVVKSAICDIPPRPVILPPGVNSRCVKVILLASGEVAPTFGLFSRRFSIANDGRSGCMVEDHVIGMHNTAVR
jgi:hypothetical protein